MSCSACRPIAHPIAQTFCARDSSTLSSPTKSKSPKWSTALPMLALPRKKFKLLKLFHFMFTSKQNYRQCLPIGPFGSGTCGMWSINAPKKWTKDIPKFGRLSTSRQNFGRLNFFSFFVILKIFTIEFILQNSLTKVALEQAWHTVHNKMDQLGRRNLYPTLKTVNYFFFKFLIHKSILIFYTCIHL